VKLACSANFLPLFVSLTASSCMSDPNCIYMWHDANSLALTMHVNLGPPHMTFFMSIFNLVFTFSLYLEITVGGNVNCTFFKKIN
jgi:hypothetical protein